MANRLLSGRSGGSRIGGFAYLLLLISVAVLGLVAAGSVSLGAAASRRQAEQELLVIGEEFARALLSYQSTLPRANPSLGGGPRELEDLLLDRRAGGIKRHLRKIYADPLTGRAEWGVLRHPDGSIAGVFSLSAGTPIKQSGFEARHIGFESAKRYSDWMFAANAGAGTATAAAR